MAQSPVLKGVTPVIELPMTSTASGSGTPDQFYKDFAAGKYDSVLKGMVKTGPTTVSRHRSGGQAGR